jgi:16S rRNA G966 N2-methylase RsmD
LINKLLDSEVQKFIKDHRNDDPFQLLLQAKKYTNLPINEIVQQITSYQKAKYKLPDFIQPEGIILPPPVSIEQASSERTAIFKSQLFHGNTFADLTGGSGIDTFYFSRQFPNGIYVERNSELYNIAKHNFDIHNVQNVTFFNDESEDFLLKLDFVDLIYLDPARRGEENQKLYKLDDCEPNVILLKDVLLSKAKRILIKTSPMLDISEGIRALGLVEKIFVVSVDNECKEVLFLISKQANNDPLIECVNLRKNNEDQLFTFEISKEKASISSIGPVENFLYEPNASILKAGGFSILTQIYPTKKLHINSHLYTSEFLISEFPGRAFRIKAVSSYNVKEFLKVFKGERANITTRNFPASVKEVFKKLRLKEGGEEYIFATRDFNNKPIILIAEKIKQ